MQITLIHLALEYLSLILVIFLSWGWLITFLLIVDGFWHLSCLVRYLTNPVFQFLVLYFQVEILLFNLPQLLFKGKSQLFLFLKLFPQINHFLAFRFFLAHLWRTHLRSIEDCSFGSIRELKSRESLCRGWNWWTYTDDEPHFSLSKQWVAENSRQFWVSEWNVGSWLFYEGRNTMSQAGQTSIDAGQFLNSDFLFDGCEVWRYFELLRSCQINNSQWGCLTFIL